jgi:DNA-binding beta-propeller fold protein YncE
VGNALYFEEKGVAGSIGFSWDKKTSNLYVSNFNLTPEKRDHSLTVLNDTGHSVRKIAHFGTGDGDDIDEACWTILNAKGDKLYVSSFGGNLLSVFDVSPDGMVSRIGANSETVYARRKPGTPAGDTKDMYISEDGKHLYNLGAYQTFTISNFDISSDGELSYRNEYRVSAATKADAGSYNFLGLAGFDKN